MSKLSRPAHLLKIMLPIIILLISTLACSINMEKNDPNHEATAASLNQTAVSLSVQSTRLAVSSTQPTRQPIRPAEPEQPTRAPEMPTQVPPPTMPSVPDAQTMTRDFYIINDSDFTICYVYFSLSGDTEWGYDQLDNELVYPGESYVFYDVPHGTYDINLQDCDENLIYEEYEMNIPAVDTITIFNTNNEPLCGNGICGNYENPGNCPQDCADPSGQVALTIVNETSEPVCNVWIGAPQSEWIGDILGSEIIPGWGSLTVYVDPGEWALQANDCSDGVTPMKFTPQLGIYGPTAWYVDP
jgi:hypothetical protein